MAVLIGEALGCLLELRAAKSRFCCCGVRTKSLRGLRVDAILRDGHGG